jgi:hypothetical protein
LTLQCYTHSVSEDRMAAAVAMLTDRPPPSACLEGFSGLRCNHRCEITGVKSRAGLLNH